MGMRPVNVFYLSPCWQYPVAVNAARHNRALWRYVYAVLLLLSRPLSAQKAPLSVNVVPELVQDAVQYQLADLRHPGWAIRYRVHRVDSKEDTIRDLIESKDGNVARTLQRHGKPLTQEEDAAEEARLRALGPDELARHHRSGEASDRYSVELISALPKAMTFKLTPDQPQLPQFNSPQVVLDYAPRPGFQPAGTVQSLLTGLAGRMWIDAETHHLLRIEIGIIRNLNLALGLLARVYQGGSVVYEQRPVAQGHYAYTHIEISVTLREFVVKTVPYHATLDATDAVLLPATPTLQEAVALLLNGDPGKRP